MTPEPEATAARYIVDITTMANYFGRVTGITRAEHEIARQFLISHPRATRFVYWCNEKSCFEDYTDTPDFIAVKAARQSRDYTVSHSGFGQPEPSGLSRGGKAALIVTGSGWLQNRHYLLGCLGLARRNGLRLAVYLHDLIPVLFPYYYQPGYVAVFTENLRLLVQSGALIACNSRNTQKDLLNWCEGEGFAPPATCIACLGDSFTSATPDAADLPDLPAGPFVLAVGAMHPRKNYGLLAQVWRRLAAQQGNRCPELLIVGGVTSDGKMLEAEMKADPVLRRYVRLLPAVSDAALSALYQAATLVVYPSLYEGWGLPVAEALAHGRVCLASDISAIPEIAPLGGDLLPPDDVPAWAARIRFYVQNAQARRDREAQLRALHAPRSWAQTVDAITAGLTTLPALTIPKLFIGAEVNFCRPEASAFLHSPGYAVESWGVWMQGREARLQFAVDDHTTPAGLDLTLQLPEDCGFSMTLNGQDLGRFTGPKGPAGFSVPLQKGLLAPLNTLTIIRDGLTWLTDKAPKPWARRQTGVGLISFGLISRDQHLYEETRRHSRGRGLICLLNDLTDAIRVAPHRGKPDLAGAQVSLHFLRSCPPPFSGQTPDMPCLILLQTRETGAVQLVVRQKGQVVLNQSTRIRRCGSLPFWLNLAAADGKTGDYPDPEIFLFSHDRQDPVRAELTAFFAPAERLNLLPSDLQHLPAIAAKVFYKFGADCPESPAGLFRSGWAVNRDYGVETEGGAAVITALCRNDAANPVSRIKLHCKLRHQKSATVRFVLNGDFHDIGLTDETRPVILSFPEAVENGDFISLALWLGDADQSAEIALRSLQLL